MWNVSRLDNVRCSSTYTYTGVVCCCVCRMSLLVLSASDVEQVISHFTPNGLQTLIARVFSCISNASPSQSSTPHRTSIPTPNHTALFMPARMSGYGLQGTTIKLVCVPQNPADGRGLPGSTLVLDEVTGVVKAIVNARNLTPLRNAAGTQKYLPFSSIDLTSYRLPTLNEPHRTEITNIHRRLRSRQTNRSSPQPPPQILPFHPQVYHHQPLSQSTSPITQTPHRTSFPSRILPMDGKHPIT